MELEQLRSQGQQSGENRKEVAVTGAGGVVVGVVVVVALVLVLVLVLTADCALCQPH